MVNQAGVTGASTNTDSYVFSIRSEDSLRTSHRVSLLLLRPIKVNQRALQRRPKSPSGGTDIIGRAERLRTCSGGSKRSRVALFGPFAGGQGFCNPLHLVSGGCSGWLLPKSSGSWWPRFRLAANYREELSTGTSRLGHLLNVWPARPRFKRLKKAVGLGSEGVTMGGLSREALICARRREHSNKKGQPKRVSEFNRLQLYWSSGVNLAGS